MIAVTTEEELHDLFDEELDETSPVLIVAGISIRPSDALKQCDPIAYRCAFLDWCDYMGFDLP